MSEQYDVQGEQTVDEKRGTLKRRGLIAGAAALVAASLLSKANTENVAASGNGTPVLLGGDSSGSGTYQVATATTWVATPGNAPIATPAFRATNGFAGTPDATGDGVQGITVNFPVGPPATVNAGVFGRNNDLNGVGTWGEAQNGTGAFGDSASGSGVAGSSSSGAGLYGQSGSGYGAAGISSSGNGVFGQSSTSNGVYGLSNGSYGIVGVTTAAGFGGCTGITETAGAAAFSGGTHNASAYAAYFSGTTVVNGNFSVTGTKSAAVPHQGGGHQLVYCVEVPESWLEDFGTANLVGGKAAVTVDPEFMAIIHSDTYHVFLTEYDGNNSLFVTKRSATGFEVHAKSGTGDGSFSWRLVGKRGDVVASRLAKINLPKIGLPAIKEGPPVTLPKSRTSGNAQRPRT